MLSLLAQLGGHAKQRFVQGLRISSITSSYRARDRDGDGVMSMIGGGASVLAPIM